MNQGGDQQPAKTLALPERGGGGGVRVGTDKRAWNLQSHYGQNELNSVLLGTFLSQRRTFEMFFDKYN